jgi:protein kinase A
MPRKNSFKLQDFELLRVVSVGVLSWVRIAVHVQSKQVFAIKAISKFQVVAKNRSEFVIREKDALACISNPFVVKCFARFQDQEHLFFVFEYLQGGDLARHLRLERSFSIDVCRFYLAEIIEALSHLHSRNFIFRALKPENLVLDSQGHIRLVDFGMSKRLGDGERTFTVSGTPDYLAPEVILKIGHGEEADIWTLGVVLFEFLTGRPPFSGKNQMVLYEKILNLDPNFIKIYDKDAEDLCVKLLQKDFANRINIKDIKKHQFFHGVDWRQVRNKKLKPVFLPSISNELDSSNFPFVEDAPVVHPFAQDVDIFPGFN